LFLELSLKGIKKRLREDESGIRGGVGVVGTPP
jgi:hypothetical protein